MRPLAAFKRWNHSAQSRQHLKRSRRDRTCENLRLHVQPAPHQKKKNLLAGAPKLGSLGALLAVPSQQSHNQLQWTCRQTLGVLRVLCSIAAQEEKTKFKEFSLLICQRTPEQGQNKEKIKVFFYFVV
jgi:hypothetical protein